MPAAASAAKSSPNATGRSSGDVASATSDWLGGSYTSNASPSRTTATAASVRERAPATRSWPTAVPTRPTAMVARGPHRSESRPPSRRDGMVATPNAASRNPAWATDAPCSATSVTDRNGSVKAPSRFTARATTSSHTLAGSDLHVVTVERAIVSDIISTLRRSE